MLGSKGDTLVFPPVSLSGLTGNVNFNFLVILPSGMNEPDTLNNRKVSTINIANLAVTAPYTQGFEATTIEASKWIVMNPDNSTTWSSATTAGIAGSTRSAKMDFFNYADSGQIDFLMSPIITPPATGYFRLNFKVAYRPYSATYLDRLSVKTTDNCGATFSTPLWSKQGITLATGVNTTTAWTPAVVTDWRDESVDLNSFVGGQPFRIAFEGRNGYGNNLYVDAVSLINHTSKPIASFTFAVANGCAPYNVSLTSKVFYADSIRWVLPGGATSTADNPTASIIISGTHQIQLISYNMFGNDTLTQTVTIGADPKANFTASDTILYISTSQNMVTFTNQSTNASVYVWDFGDGSTGTQTAPTKIYNTPGQYTVSLIARNGVQCRDTVIKTNHITVLQNPSSVNENKFGRVYVYPNPTTDLLHVNYQLKNNLNATIMIYNLMGEVVYSEKLAGGLNGNKELSIKNLNSGIYLLQLCGQDGCLNLKIQKQ